MISAVAESSSPWARVISAVAAAIAAFSPVKSAGISVLFLLLYGCCEPVVGLLETRSERGYLKSPSVESLLLLEFEVIYEAIERRNLDSDRS